MLNEQKIRLMTDLARFEGHDGKEELRISKFYRSDYIGIALLKNLILTTFGYFLLWAAVVAYNMDYLLDNLHKMKLSVVILEFVLGYVIVVTVYSIITYVKRFARYAEAKKNVKSYYTKLGDLAKVYGQEDQKMKNKELLGGNHS